MEPETRKKPIHYYEIDLFRFSAAVSVVLYHLTFAGYQHRVSPVYYPVLGEIFKYGFLGVELFFMISGYVVIMSARGKTVSQFFVSRATRLYPAYWVACSICFFVVRLFALPLMENGKLILDSSPGHYLVNLTMLQTFFGLPNLDGVYWTLAYEICFYFLIALAIGFNWMQRLPLVICAWLTYCILASLAFNTGPFSTLLFPSYAPYFIAGMLFFLIQDGQKKSLKLHAMLIASYCLAVQAVVNGMADVATHYHHEFSAAVGVALVSSFFIAFLLLVHGKLHLGPSKLVLWAGALTYPIYLSHHNIGYVALQRLGNKVDKHILLVGLCTAVLLLAYLIHVLIERRYANRLGQHLRELLART